MPTQVAAGNLFLNLILDIALLPFGAGGIALVDRDRHHLQRGRCWRCCCAGGWARCTAAR